jgi:hypothetical protein
MLGLYVNGVLAGKVMFTPLCIDWPEKMVVKLAPMLLANVVESEPTGFIDRKIRPANCPAP